MELPDYTDPGIYCLTCAITGKVYVGRAVNVRKRIYSHNYSVNYKGTHLSNAMRAHGLESFTVSILERVTDPATLKEREQYWIDSLNAADPTIGYNLCPRGDGPQGFKHGPEMRAKMSALWKGKKRPPEFAEKMRQVRKDQPMSDEAKAKISQARMGMHLSQETRSKISKARLGMHYSQETRDKMSAAKQQMSDETRAKMSAAHKGMTYQTKAPPPPPTDIPLDKNTRKQAICDYLKTYPDCTLQVLSDYFHTPMGTLYTWIRDAGFRRQNSAWVLGVYEWKELT